KRTTEFSTNCTLKDGSLIDAIDASISPDPVISGQDVTFSVSGKLSHDIPDGGLIFIAGSSFNANPILEAPADLPSKYSIQVLVVNMVDIDLSKDIIGCITAYVGSNGPSNKNFIENDLLTVS
ncbi:5508_t:CDS:2, partial [Dentiscutata erythropus]